MTLDASGIYETLVTEALVAELASLTPGLRESRSKLRSAEAADRLALHISRVIKRLVASLDEKDRVAVGVRITRLVMSGLAKAVSARVASASAAIDLADRPVHPGEVLHAITRVLPDGSAEKIRPPLIPLLDTAILTNAPGEPTVGSQVLTEIHSADAIDLVMAFIRYTGISPMLDALREHTSAGRKLRVLTTTYTGSTEARALDVLRDAGAEIRVSYDTGTTRLHAKSWLFHRHSGFSTAYIGSSNLTHSAQVTGLEWNVRVSGARNPDVVDKVAAVFESYWNGGNFLPYDRDQFLERNDKERSGTTFVLSPLEIRLEPFQEDLLAKISFSRSQGHHRNLLVAATGTGKTVMAAVDFSRLAASLPRGRLLFVAHREEILTQALNTFRHALRQPSFGELWVGRHRPQRFEHVFASIQSLAAAGFEHLGRDHFDVVIIDEFHHAAAKSYTGLLEHVQPVELLGLTATPERSDGLPILPWFDDRIAAELRLWDAIDQHRLTPFVYYGVHDNTDLRDVPWRRGAGYDVERLTEVLTANDAYARVVLKELDRRTGDTSQIRALGFCVSIKHARFMARVFNEAGVKATAVWSDTPDAERVTALHDLRNRKTNVVFSVDLFNEGVDVPAVDTVLFLRPTDSPTLFLQQLGRGLRRLDGKSVCTVLDFVGQHRKEFRYDRRFRALLGGTRKDLERQISDGFPFLPAGCHMELDRVATELVLENVRQAVPSRWAARVAELQSMATGDQDVALGTFLAETGLELEDVYAGGRSWTELRASAGLPIAAAGAKDKELLRGCGRMLHVDDGRRLAAYRRFLKEIETLDPAILSTTDRRLLQMLVAGIADKVVTKTTALAEGIALLRAHPRAIEEMAAALEVLEERVAHTTHPLASHPDVPLEVHARYSRLEILAAFGFREGAKMPPWQTGVLWAEDAESDLLAFTLDKTTGGFSPTTRYRDYAVSRELIHWESQSTTRAESAVGRRYQQHAKAGSSVMLFARLNSEDRAFWFLGPATYVRHEGEQPMAITWRLVYPLPADLYTAFAAAVA
jgi:superfamily II DNA or RNA helicase/HKD family nuclease